jgi:hypothetical protein
LLHRVNKTESILSLGDDSFDLLRIQLSGFAGRKYAGSSCVC